MRRFRVWLDVQISGEEAKEEIVEMPDDATDKECQEKCKGCLEDMIATYLETGWNEILPDGTEV